MHVFRPPKCEPQDQTQPLSIQLALLRALRLQPGTCVEVRVSDWTLTQQVIQALSGLPHWPNATLHFHKCTWPLQPSQYAQLLPAHVPASYTHWVVENEVAHEPVATAVRAGVSAHRRALGLEPVCVAFKVVSSWLGG